MKMVSLLSISFLVSIYFVSCKETRSTDVNSLNNDKTIEIEDSSKHQNIEPYQVVNESGLEGKKFYFLKGKIEGNLILERYADDFEMKKYIFEKDKFIDGDNVMEPSEWNVHERTKYKTEINYVVSLKGNNSILDTLYFEYFPSSGILYHNVKSGNKPMILIDSSRINTIKIIDKVFEEN